MQKIEHNSLCETETYKGMTEEQLIKCLEYKTKTGCELCDLKPDSYCQTCNVGLMKQALDLIKRQKAEIERLQNAYKQCAWERDTFLEQLKTAKSEAIKEFAEKFKKKAGSIVTSCQGYEIYETKKYQISAVDYDNLVKEMTEVNDGE